MSKPKSSIIVITKSEEDSNLTSKRYEKVLRGKIEDTDGQRMKEMIEISTSGQGEPDAFIL